MHLFSRLQLHCPPLHHCVQLLFPQPFGPWTGLVRFHLLLRLSIPTTSVHITHSHLDVDELHWNVFKHIQNYFWTVCRSFAKLQVTALFSEACRINLVEMRRWAGSKYVVGFYLSKRRGVKLSSHFLPRKTFFGVFKTKSFCPDLLDRATIRPLSDPSCIEAKCQYTKHFSFSLCFTMFHVSTTKIHGEFLPILIGDLPGLEDSSLPATNWILWAPSC